jgi:hypothetical protein
MNAAFGEATLIELDEANLADRRGGVFLDY